MNHAKDLRTAADDLLARAKTLRDEAKVKIHLAGMEAKSAFDRLEPRLHELQREVKAQGTAARDEIHEMLNEARESVAKLGRHLI